MDVRRGSGAIIAGAAAGLAPAAALAVSDAAAAATTLIPRAGAVGTEIHAVWLIAAGLVLGLTLLAPVFLWMRHRFSRAARTTHEANDETVRLREMLAVAPDGYYCWRYLPREREVEVCSRRMAVLLGLAEGTASTYADVLASLDEESALLLDPAVAHLRADGTPFELALSANEGERSMLAFGLRSATDEGTPLADVVWMRDITDTARIVQRSLDEAVDMRRNRDRLAALLDSLPLPVWMRDETLALTVCNQAYAEAVEASSAEIAVTEGLELAQGAAAQRQARALAALARATGTARTETGHLVIKGERRLIAVTEVPIERLSDDDDHTQRDGEPDDDPRCTAGVAFDMTRVEEVEDELSRHLAAQRTVLENLATAIALFGHDTRLAFSNSAFARLWRLDGEWFEAEATYSDFLESLRERRRLPEVADFPAFKRQELSRFNTLVAPLEDLMHLPDGTTLRRLVSPHPLGGLQFIFEDVTDRLALERSYNTLIAVQRETLDHLSEAVAVFGADGRLRLFNPAYVALWGHHTEDLAAEPRLSDLLEAYQPFFADVEDWPAFKIEMQGLLTDRTPRQGRVARSDGSVLSYASFPLPDGGELVTYRDVTDSVRVEWALLERATALDAANRLRTELVGNLAHEVRPQLEAIGALADALIADARTTDANVVDAGTPAPADARTAAAGDGDAPAPEGEEAHAPTSAGDTDTVAAAAVAHRRADPARIRDTAAALVAIIDDVVDLASLEAGELALELDTFDIRELLQAITALTRERMRRQTLTLSVQCPETIGWMVGDERRIKQVLLTLVTAAVERSAKGAGVTLRADRVGAEMVFVVIDGRLDTRAGGRAEGVAPDPSRAGVPVTDPAPDTPADRGDGGPPAATPARTPAKARGVNLDLARNFVELHGGQLEIAPFGQGTIAICRIPTGGSRAQAAPSVPETPAAR